MTYLLDTNAWIGYVNQRSSAIVARMRTLLPADVRLCSVVLGELFYGAFHSSRPSANLALVASVTHNTGEFSRVPGLVLEDWELTP